MRLSSTHLGLRRLTTDLPFIIVVLITGMNRDPTVVGRAKVGAETFAGVVNSFVDPISWKTMVSPYSSRVPIILSLLPLSNSLLTACAPFPPVLHPRNPHFPHHRPQLGLLLLPRVPPTYLTPASTSTSTSVPASVSGLGRAGGVRRRRRRVWICGPASAAVGSDTDEVW